MVELVTSIYMIGILIGSLTCGSISDRSLIHSTCAYITTHSQTHIFCIVSRVDKRYNILYNTPDTGCLECYRPHASVDTTTPGIDRKHIHCRNMPEIRT